MKQPTAPWTAAVVVAALTAVPAGSQAQTPQEQTPQAQQQPRAQQPPPAKRAPRQQPPPEQPPASPAVQTPGQVNEDAARRHLTAARDTLSQLTQLPEAAQLTGDARTQVSQLITNFNELITTQTEWRGNYAKVQANLTALLGAERTDESTVPPPATGTAGAVGTSGVATLDPKVREKLVEFRSTLLEFERASGAGSDAPAPAPPPRDDTPRTPDPTPDATATTRMATAPAATTTTGVTPSQPQTGTPSATASAGEPAHTSAMHHIAAIEAILNPPSTTGAAADVKMDRTQIEQIRMHLAELKKLMQQTDRR